MGERPEYMIESGFWGRRQCERRGEGECGRQEGGVV